MPPPRSDRMNARFETVCVHLGEHEQRRGGPAAPPIVQASTFTHPSSADFARRESADYERFDYTRTSNPTTKLLEDKLAALEGGEVCRGFGSGMAAISAAILANARAGDHIVCVDTVYGPTRQLLTQWAPKYGIETTFAPGLRIDDFAAAAKPNTKVLYLESPSSLVFATQDLKAAAEWARSRGIVTMIDNSYATPYFQRPIVFGVDLVIHTATKYIGGHSDVVAGFVIGSRERMTPLIEHEGKLLGGVLDPFAGWLLLRGLRTLAVRLERHQSSALTIARRLVEHPRVARVWHPALPDHPGHALAMRQMSGTSGMLSFALKDAPPGPTDAARDKTRRVVDALKYFSIAVSWGGFESLAIPILLRDPGEPQGRWGVRLSVGLEHEEDLWQDLSAALAVD